MFEYFYVSCFLCFSVAKWKEPIFRLSRLTLNRCDFCLRNHCHVCLSILHSKACKGWLILRGHVYKSKHTWMNGYFRLKQGAYSVASQGLHPFVDHIRNSWGLERQLSQHKNTRCCCKEFEFGSQHPSWTLHNHLYIHLQGIWHPLWPLLPLFAPT